MWTQLLAVMIKELRQAFRDRRMVAILLVAPVIQMVVLGYAVKMDVDHIPTVLCDQDRTPESRALASAFFAGHTFELVGSPAGAELDAERASRLLEEGSAAAVLVLPRGFAERQKRQAATPIQVLIDGTDPNRTQIAANSAMQFLLGRAVAELQERAATAMAAQGASFGLAQLVLTPRISFNPRLDSSIYMVPAVAAILLLLITTVLTSMGIARERELGTIEQILVTPLSPAVLLTGKCLPFAVIGLVDVTALLAVGSLLFEVPLRGSLLVIYGGTLLYLLTTLGIGIFISTSSRSQQQAMLGAFFFLLPAILLSGFATPIENMPAWIRPITYLDPLRYYVEIMRSCLLKGSGFWDLLPQLLALLIFGIAILTLSALRFKKRLA
jgi:ABC-2 type transport system permease protein